MHSREASRSTALNVPGELSMSVSEPLVRSVSELANKVEEDRGFPRHGLGSAKDSAPVTWYLCPRNQNFEWAVSFPRGENTSATCCRRRRLEHADYRPVNQHCIETIKFKINYTKKARNNNLEKMINQSINQTNHQSINQSNQQLLNQSINQSIINQSTNQSTNQSINQSIDWLIEWSLRI